MPIHWWLTKDGDLDLLKLYERHYSCDNKHRRIRQFVGPGEKIVLRTWCGRAGWAWRQFIDDSGQQGVNCAFFRNETQITSSELVRQADAVADFCWPGKRHYTYVDPKEVRSRNPGYCFIVAGWRRCGVSPKGLLILERMPQ